MSIITHQEVKPLDTLRREESEMQRYRENWRRGFSGKNLLTLETERAWWEDAIEAHPRNAAQDLKILEELDARVDVLRDKLIRQGERDNPLAFCRPTWEQAQFINSWSPDYDPDKAPEGYNSVANFGGKRSLKTTASVLSAILWMVPNDPQWEIFTEQEDAYGRGKYRILRRPQFDIWRRRGQMAYDDEEPPMQGRQLWHGCVDEAHWKTKIDKQYRRWMPMKFIQPHQDGKSLIWNITDRYFETRWGCRMTGMLYKSDIQAWGGEELAMVIFDEGPPRNVIEEVVSRALYIGWSYTPAEAANTSDRVQVAREVYEGKLMLVGQTKIIQSDMRNVPSDIIPADVLKRRVDTLTTLGEAGQIAMRGGFYDSSPRVFDLFERDRHVLPLRAGEVSRAICGESTPAELKAFPWLEKFKGANIIRGFDEGFVHPAACVWVALLKSGERVVYREFCATSTSIAERAKLVVEMSGNELEAVETGWRGDDAQRAIAALYSKEIADDQAREKATGDVLKRFREKERIEVIRKTFADPKLFKRDPNHIMQTWGDQYRRKGLTMEPAALLLPEQRTNFVNGLFRANGSRRHLNPTQETEALPHGYDLYICQSCPLLIERLERYLWEQISTGPRQGQFSGKPAKTGDDLPDALCYGTTDKLRWVDPAEIKDRHEMHQAA